MSNKLGSGFHVELLLKTNKESFDQGRKAIDGVGIGVTNLLGTVRTAVPLIAAGLTAINGQTEKTANTGALLGLGVKTMDAWGAAAKKAEVDVGGLTRGLSSLDNVVTKIQKGELGAASKEAQALGWLGIPSMEDFNKLSPEKRIAFIFNKANEIYERSRKDILAKRERGELTKEEADEQIRQAILRGKDDIASIVGEDWGMVFAKDRLGLTNFWSWVAQAYEDAYDIDVSKAAGFNHELEDTLHILQQLSRFGGSEFGAAFTPLLHELNEFLRDNKDSIKSGISDLADSLGTIVTAITPFAGTVLTTAVTTISNLAGAIAALINQDYDEFVKRFVKATDSIHRGTVTLAYGDQTDESYKLIEEFQEKYPYTKPENLPTEFLQRYIKNYDSDANFRKWTKGIGIGIDVEAARKKVIKETTGSNNRAPTQDELKKQANKTSALSFDGADYAFVQDLTHGFMPGFGGNQTINSGGNTVNMTVNVNGNSDVATIKQAAYDGASAGLIQAQAAGLDKLQLMSGIA